MSCQRRSSDGGGAAAAMTMPRLATLALAAALRPAAALTRLDLPQQRLPLLARTKGNGDNALSLQDCKRRFNSCWDPAGKAWRDSPECAGTSSDCVRTLCTAMPQIKDHELETMCVKTGDFHLIPCWVGECLNEEEEVAWYMNQATEQLEQWKPLVFLHIPKNGGTEIENVGIAHHIQWGRFNPYLFGKQLMPDGYECNRWHVPPRQMSRPNVYEISNVFCVLRHPYERIVSEYNYLLSAHWGHASSRIYRNGLYDKEECTAPGLNRFVQETMSRMLEGKRFLNDCHHVPQADYVFDQDGAKVCHEWLYIDDVESSFSELVSRQGYPSNVRVVGKTNSKALHCGRDLSARNLSRDSKALLDQVYWEDFEKLGFEPM